VALPINPGLQRQFVYSTPFVKLHMQSGGGMRVQTVSVVFLQPPDLNS
jgi:hypothetical protein